MDIITIDFETYYDQEYSLSKMSTEAYIRDSRFEVIGVGVQVNDCTPRWFEEAEFAQLVAKTDFSNRAILCHHTQFDGAILAWKYGVKPKVWLDTIPMARVLLGGYVKSVSLASLAAHYEIGAKGTEVINAKGKRRSDFSNYEYEQYGDYCKNDVALTYILFNLMSNGFVTAMEKNMPLFPKSELRLIDAVTRMFTEPHIILDEFALAATLADTKYLKERALVEAGVDKEDLMSNVKFAELLRRYGVEPPTKISPTTGRETFAFAKTDAGMTALLEYDDVRVQAIVNARLKNKTTLVETRLEKMLAQAKRGPMPVYLKVSGADQTHRLSGGDGTNMQNNPRGSPIRKAMLAPAGYTWVVVDSSNIEARILDTLAGQDDMVEVYRAADRGEGPDVYCVMAGSVYGRTIVKGVDKDERQHGKIIKLGCGYGMGASKYRETARLQNVVLSEEQAENDVNTYRNTHDKVVDLWAAAGEALSSMLKGVEREIDPGGIVYTTRNAIILPNGTQIKYPNLRREDKQWVYDSGRIKGIKIYGGKVVENIVQALAKIVVIDQSIEVSKKYPFPLSMHDEGIYMAHIQDGPYVLDYALSVFRTSPTWWPKLPLNAEGDVSVSYGMAK